MRRVTFLLLAVAVLLPSPATSDLDKNNIRVHLQDGTNHLEVVRPDGLLLEGSEVAEPHLETNIRVQLQPDELTDGGEPLVNDADRDSLSNLEAAFEEQEELNAESNQGWWHNAVDDLENAWESVQDAVDHVGDHVEDVMSDVGDALGDAVDTVGDAADTVGDAVGDVVDSIGDAIGNIFG